MKQYLIVKIYFSEDNNINYTVLRQTLQGLAKKIDPSAKLVDYALIRATDNSKKRGAKPPKGVIAIYEVELKDERLLEKVEEVLEGKKRFKWVKDYSVIMGLTAV